MRLAWVLLCLLNGLNLAFVVVEHHYHSGVWRDAASGPLDPDMLNLFLCGRSFDSFLFDASLIRSNSCQVTPSIG